MRGNIKKSIEKLLSITEKSPVYSAWTAGILLFLFFYYAFTWGGLTKEVDFCRQPFCDFVDYYYPMGEAIFITGVPVEGFLYSAFTAILFSLFPPIGLEASLAVWGILLIIFVVLYIYLSIKLLPDKPEVKLLITALVLSSYPAVLNQLGGQVSLFIIVPLLGFLILYEKGRGALGALLLALAVSFKFYPVLFFIPFLLKRDIRFLIFGTAALITILFLIPAIFIGAGNTFSFYENLIGSFIDSEWVTKNPHSQFFPHYMLRVTDAFGFDTRSFLPVLRWISYAIAAANIGLIYFIQRSGVPRANLRSFQIIFMTIPFVLKTSWPHDFIFLPFIQAFIAGELITDKNSVETTAIFRSRNAMAALLIISIILSNIIFFNLLNNFELYGHLGFLFLSNLLLLVIFYIKLLPLALRSASVSAAASQSTT
ncbi:glycosyltransferase family 87 protein [Bacteroidota bacterium]